MKKFKIVLREEVKRNLFKGGNKEVLKIPLREIEARNLREAKRIKYNLIIATLGS